MNKMYRMNKLLLSLTLLMVIALTLSSCGGAAPAATSAPAGGATEVAATCAS